MRQCDLAGQQWVIVGNVGRLIYGAMLQLNTQASTELFNIKAIPANAQLFTDCFSLTRGKLFLAHSIKLIPVKTGRHYGVFTPLVDPEFEMVNFSPQLVGQMDAIYLL